MRFSTRLPIFSLLLLCLLFATFACKDKKGAMPDKADARVAHFASKAPANAETFFFVPEVDEFRTKLASLQERLKETGMIERVQKSFEGMFGIDILDSESWKAAGLTPKSSIGVVVYKSRPVLMMYVDNRQAFEKVLIAQTKEALGVEAVTKQETIGKHKVKVLNDDPVRQIAWVYDGKLAIVAMPVIDSSTSLDEGSAALIATKILDTKPEESLSKSPQYQKFLKNVAGKGAFALYSNVEPMLNGPDVQARLKEDPNAETAIAFVKKNIDYFGAYGDVKGDRVTARLVLGGRESFNAIAKEISKIETSGNWEGFATDKTALGVRLSVDPQKILTFALTAMNEDEQRAFRRNLKQTGDQIGLDLEEDVIKQMTGHAGIFFYGIAGGGSLAVLQSAQNPAALASKLGLIAVFRFKTKEAVDRLLTKALESQGGGLSIVPLVVNGEEMPGFRSLVLPIPNVPIRVFIHNDTVLLSTTAFGDQAIHGYLSGTRTDKKLGDVEGMDLGKEFATGKQFTGLYLNAERLFDNTSALLNMAGVGAMIEIFQEAQLKVGADGTGAHLELIADLDEPKPDETKPGTAPKSPDEKK